MSGHVEAIRLAVEEAWFRLCSELKKLNILQARISLLPRRGSTRWHSVLRAGQRFVFKLCLQKQSDQRGFFRVAVAFLSGVATKNTWHLASYTFVANENKCVCVPHSQSRGSVDAEAVQLIDTFLHRKNSLE